MNVVFLFIGNFFIVLCYLSFIQAILKGKARPHRMTRFILAFITIIAAISLIIQHNTVTVWLISLSAILMFIIFILTLKFGMGGWSKSDIFCLILSIFGVILWKVTDNPSIAIYSSIIVNFIAFTPTLIKTYHHPGTEVWYVYFLAIIAAVFNMMANTEWTTNNIIYPLYLVLINIFTIALIKRIQIKKLFSEVKKILSMMKELDNILDALIKADAEMQFVKAVFVAKELNKLSPGDISNKTALIQVGKALSQLHSVVYGEGIASIEVVDTARKFALRDIDPVSGQLVLQGFAAERATIGIRRGGVIADLRTYNQIHNALNEKLFGSYNDE